MMPAQALDFAYSCQASTEHFEQCDEFPLVRNDGLDPLAVTVPIPFAGRGRRYRVASLEDLETQQLVRPWV